MKLRWKITFGLVTLTTITVLFLSGTGNRTQRELQKTRSSLRQQGFKLDLTEFTFATSPEMQARAARLATTTRAELTNRASPRPGLGDVPDLMMPAGTNVALVIWKLERLANYRSRDLWPELRDALTTNATYLADARQAVLSGPIRFEPIGSTSPNPLLPYLPDLKRLVETFGFAAMLALHDDQKAAAWTNLLTVTCLATSYDPEPIDVSHLVRCSLVETAYGATWNALQSGNWTDTELAELQRRWAAVDFWSGLPETAAYSRANMTGMAQLERQQPITAGMTLKEAIHSPRYALPGLREYLRRFQYRHRGSYEDETALLLYYRDRELDLRRALQCPTWEDMRQLPGVTNLVLFASKNPSPMQSMMNLRQLNLGFLGQGQGLLGGVASAETRRSLIMTALALARYRGQRCAYPEALQELVPDLLPSPAIDFMDGKPLRYARTGDGHFVLYSVGLDCVDNGGGMLWTKRMS